MAASPKPQTHQLPPITLLMLSIELGLILIATFIATTHLQNTSPTMMLAGGEFSQFAQAGGNAATVFQLTGKIPLWNPFNYYGEPTLESVTSYVLNPFMMLPLLLFGFIQGTKVGLLLHIGLMAYGGWTLARMLGLRTPGRLFLALLLLGSGSMSGQMRAGWYQMTCAQAYMPWVLAGLYGVLYTPRRWAVGLLVVSTSLMLFAGVFWYILPFAAVCGIVVVVGLVELDPQSKMLVIRDEPVRRLVWAVVFMVLLSAVRILPLGNSFLYGHPTQFPTNGHPFGDLFLSYFRVPADENAEWPFIWETGHYIIPGLLAGSLLVARILIFRKDMDDEWRVLIPGGIAILVITFLAQGGMTASQWIFQVFPFLQEFRQIGRMMAVASPWIAIIMAVWLDRIWPFLIDQIPLRLIRLEQRTGIAWKKTSLGLVALVGIILLTGLVVYAVMDVDANWKRNSLLISVWDDSRGEIEGLAFLRQRHPGIMLSVESQGLGQRIGYFAPLLRAAQGAPDGRIYGVKPTLGAEGIMNFIGDFAVPGNGDYIDWLSKNGFNPIEGAPVFEGETMAFENPNIPPYAFVVTLNTLDKATEVLTRADVMPIESYNHHIETIDATLTDYPPDSVFVILEINYPGWVVTIDGVPATLESVSGRLGVKLPDRAIGSPPITIRFTYRPTVFYIGFLITLLGMVLTSAYLLKLDQRFMISRYAIKIHQEETRPEPTEHGTPPPLEI